MVGRLILINMYVLNVLIKKYRIVTIISDNYKYLYFVIDLLFYFVRTKRGRLISAPFLLLSKMYIWQ